MRLLQAAGFDPHQSGARLLLQNCKSLQQEDAMWWNDYWSMPWMFFGPLVMIFFVIVCVTMMVLMMRGGGMRHGRNTYAIDILRERYARGEINQTEYEERRRFLEA